MEAILQEALVYVIGGLPIALNVVLTVQAAKVFGFVGGNKSRLDAPQFAVISGLFFGLGGLAAALFPAQAVIIDTVNRFVVGSLSAGLLYEYILKTVGGAAWTAILGALGSLTSEE